MFSHLNQADVDPSYSDAVRRVIGHLGDYIALIVRPLNLRPTGAALLVLDAERVEVRVNSPSGNIVVAIGPDADIAGEAYWLRMLATRNLAAPRLIRADLSGVVVPFSYLVLAFVGGVALNTLAEPALIKIAARAAGRMVRRMHQIPAAAFGRPSPADRWPLDQWPQTVRAWLDTSGTLQVAADLIGADLLAALFAATLEHADFTCTEPRILHSAIAPARIIVTSGESIQLEVLTRPGPIIAGDPLLDVAQALLPIHPAAFRQGFLEGYAAAGPLDAQQRMRLRRLALLALLHHTIQRQDAQLLVELPGVISIELAILQRTLQ
jgi:aminoglycoside phosphotransferase (APT) family kinase protein